jgi:hypothetical protein
MSLKMHGTRKDWNRDGTSRRRRVKKEKDGEEKEREEVESVEVESVEETENERRKRRRVNKGKGKAKAETDGSEDAEWRKALTEVVLGIEEQIEGGFDELWRRVSMKIDDSEGVERVMRRVQRLEDNLITESDLEEGPSRRTGGLKRKAEEDDSEVEVVAERFGESGWLDLEAEETDGEGTSEEDDEDGEKEDDDGMDIY